MKGKEIDIQDFFNFISDQVGTHSIRFGAALEMYLADTPIVNIML